jgi:hypothetical protein
VPGKKDDPNYEQLRGHVPRTLAKRFKQFCLDNDLDYSLGLETLIEGFFTYANKSQSEGLPDKAQPNNDEGRSEDIANVLFKFTKGIRPDDNDLIFAAEALNVNTHDLMELRDRLFQKQINNGGST